MTQATPAAEGAVLRHLAYLRLRNLRQTSVYNRHRALIRLSRYLGGPILYASREQLTGWQETLSTSVAPASRAAELAHVRQFFAWALREGLLLEDPTRDLPTPRVPRRLPRPIRDERLAPALDAADPKIALILSLAAFAGLRACEIARLTWPDVDLDADPPTLLVADGKGGKQRRVPVAEPVVAALQAMPGARRGPVVPRGDGRAGANAPHRISHLANDHLHSCGVPDSLHSLRHRAATSWYAATRDLRVAQELLGHSSPATTAGYAAHSEETALAAIRAGASLRGRNAAAADR